MKDSKKYSEKLKRLLSSEEFTNFKIDNNTLIELGYECVESGDYKRAFYLFSAGVRLNGPEPDILNGLGISLCELGRLRASKIVLEKAVSMYPEDAITLANLAGVCWEIGDYDMAVYFYQKAIKSDPNIIESHINLVNLFYERGDIFMAYVTCLELLKSHPESQEGVELLDELLLNMGFSLI